MDTKFFTSWSEQLFQSIQPVYDGGLFSILMMKDVMVRITQSSTYINLIHKYISKPYYNFAIAVMTIWSVIIFITVIVLLLRICCKHLDCCFKCQKGTKHVLDKISRECFNRKLPDTCCICSRKKSSVPSRKRKCITCAIFFTVIIMTAGFITGIYFTVRNSTEFQKVVTKSNSSFTLANSVSLAVNNVNLFFVEGISQANASTISILNSFNRFLSKLVDDAVYDLTRQLLTAFGATETLNLGKEAVGNITQIMNAMTYISVNGSPVFKNVNTFAGSIKLFKDTLQRELPKVCSSLGSATHRQQCQRFVERSNLLVLELNQSEVDLSPSLSILLLMKQLKINLSPLSAAVENSEKQIKSLVTSVHTNINKNFKVEQILGSVPSIWTTVENMTNSSVLVHLQNFQRANPTQQYLDIGVQYWKSIFDAVLSILMCLGVITLATCIFAIFIYCYSRRQKKTNRTEAYKMKLENMVNNSFDEPYPKHISSLKEVKIPAAQHVVKVLFLFHFLLGVAIIVPCLFVAISFLFGGLLTTEGCRYMVEVKGVAILDSNVNTLIDQHWPTLKSQLNFSDFILPLDFKQPKSPVKAIFNTCAERNATILPALQMTGLFNASAFADLKMFKDMINTGETFVIQAIKSANLAHLLPMSILSFIDQGQDFLKKFIDPMNYTISVAALRKPILKMNATQYKSFVNELALFLQSHGTGSAAVVLRTYILPDMKNYSLTYNALNDQLKEMLKQFLHLHNRPVMNDELLKLKASLKFTGANLANSTFLILNVRKQYRQLGKKLTTSIVGKLSQSLTQLENSLFPCHRLNSAYTIVTRSVCGNLRSGINSYTLALAITVLWVQVLFCFSWCLLSRLRPKVCINDHSDC